MLSQPVLKGFLPQTAVKVMCILQHSIAEFLSRQAELHIAVDTDTYLNKRSKVNLAYISLSQRKQHWSSEAHHFLCNSGLFMLALHYLLTDQFYIFF